MMHRGSQGCRVGVEELESKEILDIWSWSKSQKYKKNPEELEQEHLSTDSAALVEYMSSHLVHMKHPLQTPLNRLITSLELFGLIFSWALAWRFLPSPLLNVLEQLERCSSPVVHVMVTTIVT